MKRLYIIFLSQLCFISIDTSEWVVKQCTGARDWKYWPLFYSFNQKSFCESNVNFESICENQESKSNQAVEFSKIHSPRLYSPHVYFLKEIKWFILCKTTNIRRCLLTWSQLANVNNISYLSVTPVICQSKEKRQRRWWCVQCVLIMTVCPTLLPKE